MTVKLKPFPAQDSTALNDLYAQVNQRYCLVHLPVPLPQEETARYLEVIRTGNNAGQPFICFGIYAEAVLIGKIELTRQDDGDAELDVVIRESETGKGYGTQALGILLKEVYRRGWCRAVYAYVSRDNSHARRMLTHAGFRQMRAFQADVMRWDGGSYRVEPQTGYEYIYYPQN